MLISINSFKNNNIGQTVLAINLANMISKITKDKVLLLDLNRECDISYYLSNSIIVKGIDDFINYRRTKQLSKGTFKRCYKNITDDISIMASNESTEIMNEDIKGLLKYLKTFKYVVVDCSKHLNISVNQLLKQSDLIIDVVTQDKKNINYIKNNIKNRNEVIVINKFDGKINYDIRKDLIKIGFNRIYKLDYNVELVNEVNNLSILNYVNYDNKYNNELKKMIFEEILKQQGYSLENRHNKKNFFTDVEKLLRDKKGGHENAVLRESK